MPRGVMLTQEEKTKLKTHMECGVSNRKIAKNIGRSLNVVNNFFRLGENYGKIKRGGRKQRLSKRLKRSITRLLN